MTKIALVLGASGQLGSEIKEICSAYDSMTFYFASRNEIDLEDPELFSLIDYHCPNIVINCAAYTAVDKAEEDQEKAFAINTKATKALAVAANHCGAPLIHISSDYVYHIAKRGPLLEEDICSPKGIYAQSKYNGEDEVRSTTEEHIILRTSWLYSSFGNNFVKTMIRLGKTKDHLNIVSDQLGAPTYARDLAHTICRIADKVVHTPNPSPLFGTYNYANEGVTSWFDFAKTIFELEQIDVSLDKITTKDYNAPAPRPQWSLLSKKKIKDTFDITIPHWRDGLIRMLAALE